MQQVVSITKQGQLTIPKALLKAFGIKGSTKAVIRKKGNILVVEPKGDFWQLGASLSSKVKLSDEELREARLKFEKTWADNG